MHIEFTDDIIDSPIYMVYSHSCNICNKSRIYFNDIKRSIILVNINKILESKVLGKYLKEATSYDLLYRFVVPEYYVKDNNKFRKLEYKILL